MSHTGSLVGMEAVPGEVLMIDGRDSLLRRTPLKDVVIGVRDNRPNEHLWDAAVLPDDIRDREDVAKPEKCKFCL